jgi:hypothetical protein
MEPAPVAQLAPAREIEGPGSRPDAEQVRADSAMFTALRAGTPPS